ncbi:lipase family protein [Nocardia puris]|uniref:lipase family protein n=1 Tax=Nocardia puris TaxID=208602 RepID=UPI002E2341C8
MTNPLDPSDIDSSDIHSSPTLRRESAARAAADAMFRTAPELAPDQGAGEILRARQVRAPQLDWVDAWHLLYTSTSSTEATIAASATLLSPTLPTLIGMGPILLYCPQFRGFSAESAPSVQLQAGTDPDIEPVRTALDRGWTVVVPDGEGHGVLDAGPHTWLAGRAAAYTALDAVRAARAMPDVALTDVPVAIWGYADGGRTAIWAGELHTDYAPEVPLAGVAAGAPALDPITLITDLDGGAWSGLGLAGMIGLGQAYRHLPLDHVLTAEGRDAVADAQTLDIAELLSRYRAPLGRWCEVVDPWSTSMWRYVLTREVAGTGTPTVPVHLYHGSRDSLIRPQSTRALDAAYRARGVAVTWHEPYATHLQAAADAIGEVMTRLTELAHQDRT